MHRFQQYFTWVLSIGLVLPEARLFGFSSHSGPRSETVLGFDFGRRPVVELEPYRLLHTSTLANRHRRSRALRSNGFSTRLARNSRRHPRGDVGDRGAGCVSRNQHRILLV